MAVIELDDLSKHYGDLAANDEVSFTVGEGEIFGYLGPNGAGKTTTIRLLLGLIKPTGGTATVLGADIRDREALTERKANIGYLPDTLGFDEHLTGEAILDYFARMRGDERRAELLELFHPPLHKPVETYSSGNRRMLGIVQAFMHDPDLVIMDEPTAGLDPLKQDRLHEFVEREREDGTTIFLSSHTLGEVQRVCDRVGIIRAGELVAEEDIETLIAEHGKEIRIEFGPDSDVTPGEIAGADSHGFITDRMHNVAVEDGALAFTYVGASNDLVAHLQGFDLADLVVRNPGLEDIFKHYYRDEDADDA